MGMTVKRQPYAGSKRKLVLAYDVGTTFSGASYCFLEPDEVPVIHQVTRYPAQEKIGGDTKIPTILYYDKAGAVKAVGAEAISDTIEEEAVENKWIKAEWFKLHLRPKATSAAHVTTEIPPLPKDKTAVQVLSDFLKYLHQCARSFIEETHAKNVGLWSRIEDDTEFILSHPNGWESGQHTILRKAAVMAELVPDTEAGQARVYFVTEGEASLHYCIQSGITAEIAQDGKGILVVDAGGGTVDVSAYKKISPNSDLYEEIAPPQYIFKGAVFVNKKAEEYFKELLEGSRFREDVPLITHNFDKKTKLTFVGPDEPQFIRFGRGSDNAPKLNIKTGQLKLPGSVVAQFFEHCISAIIELIEKQCKDAKADISTIFLVGGFSASRWLFDRVKGTFSPRGFEVCRPDQHTNKAVADGAVSYHIDHFVQTRIAKYSYGVGAAVPFNPFDPEHFIRRYHIFETPDGALRIGGYFDVTLPKNTRISEGQEFRESYTRFGKSKNDPMLSTVRVPIMCYRGSRDNPRWLDEETSLYSALCHVEADLSNVPKSEQFTMIKGTFYQVSFDVILSLGLPEIKACIAWEEEGVEKRGTAKIIGDPNLVIRDS